MGPVSLRNIYSARDAEWIYYAIKLQRFPQFALEKYDFVQDSFTTFKDIFFKKLKSNIKLFKIFLYNEDPLGFIMAYDHKFNDRHIKLCICPFAENWVEFGCSLLIEYLNILFLYYDLRKVYIETTSLDTPTIKLLINFGFIEELCLSHYNTNQVDKLYYSITRKYFYGEYKSIHI